MIVRADEIPRALDLSSVEVPTGIKSATAGKEKKWCTHPGVYPSSLLVY